MKRLIRQINYWLGRRPAREEFRSHYVSEVYGDTVGAVWSARSVVMFRKNLTGMINNPMWKGFQ